MAGREPLEDVGGATEPRGASEPGPARGVLADLFTSMKPRLSTMVLITAAGGAWLAPGTIPTWALVTTLVSTAAIVGAANLANCVLERESDRHMARTMNRPLATGHLAVGSTVAVAVALTIGSLVGLLVAANELTAALAGLAFVSYVWVYTPMKRRSPMAVIVGTLPGALPPVIGWTAVTGTVDRPALVLFAILVFWQIHHFLAIAINQQDDYRKAGLATFPGEYGMSVTRWSILASSVALLATSLAAVPVGLGSWRYAIVASLLGGVAIWLAIGGFRAVNASAWAYRLFRFTLLHLGLLFVALVIDQVIGVSP